MPPKYNMGLSYVGSSCYSAITWGLYEGEGFFFMSFSYVKICYFV